MSLNEDEEIHVAARLLLQGNISHQLQSKAVETESSAGQTGVVDRASPTRRLEIVREWSVAFSSLRIEVGLMVGDEEDREGGVTSMDVLFGPGLQGQRCAVG